MPAYGEVRLTEIYPSPENGEEWIELYNDSDASAQMKDYSLIDKSGKKILIPAIELPAGHYLLATSESVLNNSGDTVQLMKTAYQIDIATYSATLSSNQSFSLCSLSPATWEVTSSITKKADNAPCSSPTPTPAPSSVPVSPTSIPVSEPTLPHVQPQFDQSSLFISEVMVQPESGEPEWVELYNNSDTTIELKDWYIDDVADGGSAPKPFHVTITSKTYVVIKLSSALFNNGGDSARLLNNNNVLIDSFSYTSSKKLHSWGRTINSSTFCLQEPTPEKENSACTEQTQKPSAQSLQSTSGTSPGVKQTLSSGTALQQTIEDYFPYTSPGTAVPVHHIPQTLSIEAVSSNPYRALSHSFAFFSLCISILAFIYIFIRIKRTHQLLYS